MLGFGGPLSISAQYSDRFGSSIRGEYTQTLGANNAFSLGLELGSDNQRLGATFAHAINKRHRIKATVEHLRQGTEFQFSSGKVDEALTQNALGFSYQHTGLNGPLNDVHFNVYYADTDGKALATNPILSVTKNGAAIGINPAQFSIAGNTLLVHPLNLNPPATYKVLRNGTLIQTITVNTANGTENVSVSPFTNGDVITVIATDNDGNESTVTTHTIVTNCET